MSIRDLKALLGGYGSELLEALGLLGITPGGVQSVTGPDVDNTDPANPVVAASGGLSPIQSGVVTMTAADLFAINSGEFQFLAAPGAAKIRAIVEARFTYALRGGFNLGNNYGAPEVVYSGTDIYPGKDVGYFGFFGALQSAGDTFTRVYGTDFQGAPFYFPIAFSDSVNKAIVVTNVGNDPIQPTGAIATSQLTSGSEGEFWAPGDTFTVDTGRGTLAAGVVDTVDGGGAILTYHFTNNVDGYIVANNVSVTATSGGGDGVSIDILTLDYSVNPIKIQVDMLYRDTTVPT